MRVKSGGNPDAMQNPVGVRAVRPINYSFRTGEFWLFSAAAVICIRLNGAVGARPFRT